MSRKKSSRKPIEFFYDLSLISKETKIPLYNLRNFETGKFQPSEKTVKKIKNFNRRQQYKISREIFSDNRKDAQKVSTLSPKNFLKYQEAREILQPVESREVAKLPLNEFSNHIYLRSKGVMRAQAEDIRSESPELVKEIGEQTERIVNVLAKNLGVDPEHIKKGMRQSDRTNDDWEQYIKERSRGREPWRPQRKVKGKPYLYEYIPEDTEDHNQWKRRFEAGYYD